MISSFSWPQNINRPWALPLPPGRSTSFAYLKYLLVQNGQHWVDQYQHDLMLAHWQLCLLLDLYEWSSWFKVRLTGSSAEKAQINSRGSLMLLVIINIRQYDIKANSSSSIFHRCLTHVPQYLCEIPLKSTSKGDKEHSFHWGINIGTFPQLQHCLFDYVKVNNKVCTMSH